MVRSAATPRVSNHEATSGGLHEEFAIVDKKDVAAAVTALREQVLRDLRLLEVLLVGKRRAICRRGRPRGRAQLRRERPAGHAPPVPADPDQRRKHAKSGIHT